jgi:hypothetical protein
MAWTTCSIAAIVIARTPAGNSPHPPRGDQRSAISSTIVHPADTPIHAGRLRSTTTLFPVTIRDQKVLAQSTAYAEANAMARGRVYNFGPCSAENRRWPAPSFWMEPRWPMRRPTTMDLAAGLWAVVSRGSSGGGAELKCWSATP